MYFTKYFKLIIRISLLFQCEVRSIFICIAEMDPHETQHIVNNIAKLVEYTNVNTTLLAQLMQAGVIVSEEKDSLVNTLNFMK